jgi:FMN phosphatase YigB (HAD superfamily)
MEQHSEVASFDIFDTVLTRVVGTPHSSFLLLGNILKSHSLIDCSVEEFARARARAEHRAFHNAGGLDSEVDLEQIYRELARALHLPKTVQNLMMQYEIKMEAEITRPVPEALDRIRSARQRGKEIVFISDMYLGTERIQALLHHHKLLKPGDRCYVSCDYAKSKENSTLFQEIIDSEGISPQRMTHCGNNSWSDVRMAEEVGIRTDPFLQGNLNRYEEILESFSWSTGGLASAMAGASRLARLTVAAPSSREAALRDVAAGVVSPILVGFVLWALQSAQKRGLKRLYFVSRDGQMLLEIARRLIKKLDYDCELHYLYGSRQAWFLPSLTQVDEEHLEAGFTGKLKLDVTFVSVQVALDRLDLQPSEIAQPLATIGLHPKDWERNLTVEERDALVNLVLTNPQVRQLVLQKAADARQVMLRYLEQEGLLDPIEFGMLDVGTGSTLHYALANVLAAAGQKPPVSFYLGLRGNPLETPFGKPEAYFFDKSLNLGFFDNHTPGVNEMVEVGCSADHGTVLGYWEKGDRVEPVLKSQSNEAVMQWGFPVVQDTILCFTEQLFLNRQMLNPQADVREATIAPVVEFWTHPSRQEAEAWGTFPMEDGWGNCSLYRCLAHPYSLKDLVVPLWQGEIIPPGGRRHWCHPAALALSPAIVQKLYPLCLRVGRKQRRIRQKLQLGQRVKKFLSR